MTMQFKLTDAQTNAKICKAIEKKVGLITAIHDESKGYAVKTFENKDWLVLPFNFVNDAAGLGFINHSLLK